MTEDEKRERNRLKMQKYRATHSAQVRAYDRARWPERGERRRLTIFKGRRCKGCEILLSSTYGAHGTVHYCTDCSKIRWKLYMREYRKHAKKTAPRAAATA